MSESIQSRIESALKQARPYLQEDGGDVEFVRFEEETGVAEVRLLGNCTNCAMSMMTLRGGIERLLLKTVSEIKRVEAVR
ncbi:MAG: NifU family protein [Bacteroidota bacterium]